MESVYVIVCDSYKLGDIESDRDVEFVTTDKDVALKYFDDIRNFCNEIKNSNWRYIYTLYQYGDGKDRHTRKEIDTCDNY